MARRRTVLGSIVLAILLFAATGLVVARFTDLRTLLGVMARGHWPWIAAGVATHVAYFVAYAFLYRLGFAIVGVASRTWSLVPIVFAGLFVNTLVPTGAGEAALFVDDAARRGQSAAHAAVGVVLVLMLELATLIPLAAWGIVFLARADLLAGWQLLAAAAFVLYLVALAVALGVSRWRPAWVRRVLRGIRRGIDRVGRWLRMRAPLAADWPERTAEHLAEAARAIATHPGQLAIASVWATVLHVINAAGLWMFVRGFGAEVPIGGLIAAFSLGIVLFVIVVIPQAAPVVEAVMTATLLRVGVAAGPAVAATLAFRGVNFWLPLVLGLGFAWRIRRLGARPETEPP